VSTEAGALETLFGPPSTILAVDDNPVNLQLIVRTLQGSGHRILAARSGRAALDIVDRMRPDLLLLDVTMPEMDGFEVCRTVKAKAGGRDIAVIFLSARSDVSDKVSGLNLGAVDYLTKPIQAEEVLARVGNHLTRLHLQRQLRQSRDRLDRELANAARMQQLILPTVMPAHPGIEFAAFYQTSRHAGGDYYDVLDLGGGRFAIVVADVSGHGAPAAIVMAMIRAVVHTYPGAADDPPAVLNHINRHFQFLWETSMFATAIYAVVDLERRTVKLSCAGHPPPMVVRDGHTVSELGVEATFMLLMTDLSGMPCVEHALQSGDRLVFYTDGITERVAADEKMYDGEQFKAALARAATRDPAAMVAQVVAEVDAFAAGHEPDDDQTLVVAAIK
jgi:sigma-B regulation protein RsbU (phosphoserine phosphatase)